ncbi:hypothetical protein CFE70_007912 [Pyrenophora teres f. teres 0-1]|nr:hypothetical protein HRS9122_05990 [Pyrenophora teres f. teres]CAA9965045.1 ABC-type Fe3+ transport system [Pyrenophora teres f. maculata]KAE8859968.1 hypothetical protein PTNB29_07199 [Pyrenophora teres f. teres]KAE8865346.1 hypothetical protein PTNB73_06234 [Pyrenophora teres f. teres]KAK1918797.1 hypothetical protein P3342_010268 [Pyrenophora teres f. teres]
MLQSFFTAAILLASRSIAYDQTLGFNGAATIETRTIDEIHKAALAEGGVVTMWLGGDERTDEDALKNEFEKRFPGMKLNLTTDLSKYHSGRFDEQLAAGKVYVDSIAFQTVHDFPRWDNDGALLHYAPVGLEKVYSPMKDVRAAFYGILTVGWAGKWNTDKLPGIKAPVEWEDWLRPEFKDKLVLTYPNDDDAVLYAFDLIMQQYGKSWFEKLLQQNPRWVRGTRSPDTIMASKNSTRAASFTSDGLFPTSNINISHPVQGSFVTWFQLAAIPKDAPHPEGAKLLHNYMLTKEWQATRGSWPVRSDVEAPKGYPPILEMPGTNITYFREWMSDRYRVERLRLWFEDKLGTAQGLSPINDDI